MPAAVLQPPDIPRDAGGWAWPHRPRFWRPRHHHAELEFNLVVSGTGRFEVGGRPYEVRAGEVLWFPPGVDHLLAGVSDDFDMWVVAFRQELVDGVRRDAPLDPLAGALGGALHRPLSRQAMAEVVGRVAAASRGNAPAAVLGEALAKAGRACGAACGGTGVASQLTSPVVRRALALLREDPELDRDRLSAAAGASPSLLAHRFRQAVGVSIPEYRARVRLHRFLALLEDGETNLLRAAHDAGFGSYAQFHRLVRATTGRTPRELLDPAARTALEQAVLPGW